MIARPVSFIGVTALALFLLGCEQANSVAKIETVATVGEDRISEVELNLAVSGLGDLDESQMAEAKGHLLSALIDQRLIAQAAKKAGLDRDPAVEISMAQASRQVLAEAYAERNFKDVAKPSESEIVDYYGRHPELFFGRRIYRVQELELRLDSSRLPELESRLKSSHSMGDLVSWVREQGIRSKSAMAVKPAEQIPAHLLDRLYKMKDGQVAILPGRRGHVLVQQLQDSQFKPVSLEQAKNAIERVLVAEKRKQAMEADLQKLRQAAEIEYATGYAPVAEPQPENGKVADGPSKETPTE